MHRFCRYVLLVAIGSCSIGAQTPPPNEPSVEYVSQSISKAYAQIHPNWVSSFTWTGKCDGMTATHPEYDVCSGLMPVWNTQRGGVGGWEPPNMSMFSPESIQVKGLSVKVNGNIATADAQVSADCRHADPPVCPQIRSKFTSRTVARFIWWGRFWPLYDLSDKGHEAITLKPEEAANLLKSKERCPDIMLVSNARFVPSESETRVASPVKTRFVMVNYQCSTGQGGNQLFVQDGSSWLLK